MLDMTPEERIGVTAIQFLQKMADIDEPETRALHNWRRFSESERETTLRVYQTMNCESN